MPVAICLMRLAAYCHLTPLIYLGHAKLPVLTYVHLSGKDYIKYGLRRTLDSGPLPGQGEVMGRSRCSFNVLVRHSNVIGMNKIFESHEARVVKAHGSLWKRELFDLGDWAPWGGSPTIATLQASDVLALALRAGVVCEDSW